MITSQIIAEGFILGLSTGIYCLGACGPFFVPYLLAEGKGKIKTNLGYILEFMLGRLIAYLLFALVVSFAGTHYRMAVPPKLLSLALIFSSLLLIAYALTKNLPQWRLCNWLTSHFPVSRTPFFLGFLIGFNICPPFIVGLMRLLELSNIMHGVLFFLSFFLGTSVYMLPLILLGPLAAWIERLRFIAGLAAMLSGIWFLINGIIILIW